MDSGDGFVGDTESPRQGQAAAGPGGEHPARGAARRLADASSRSVTEGIRSASEVVPHLDAAVDAVQDALQLFADSTTADLPTRVWLGEAADHAGEGSAALFRTEWDPGPGTGDAQGYIAARQLGEAAAGFRACLSAPGSRPLDEDDLAALVPLVGEAVDAMSGSCFQLDDLGLTDPDDDDAPVSSAGEQLQQCSERLSDAHDGLVKAAQDDRVARAAEAAWTAGAGHGRAGRPAAFDRGRGALAAGGEEREALASLLGLGPTADDAVAAAAATAYCDAHAEAVSGPAGRTAGRRYVPGQEVTTALGKPGVLTGHTGAGGRPRIRFGDGQEATVPREAIRAPLAHVLEAMPGEEGVPCVTDGDVVLVMSGRIIPWVQTADGLRPACGDTAALGRRQCEYEDSVRLAEAVMGLKPGSLFDIDQYASPFDPSRYGGNPFPGWTRGEIERQWDRPPGSLRAFDYGTESHLERLAAKITQLGFPSAVAPAAPPARSKRAPAAGPAASQSASPGV